MEQEKNKAFFAWARYLSWAELHQRHFKAFVESEHDISDYRQRWEFFGLMSAWYASLWVVIEGWKQIPLKDPLVDELLNARPDYQSLLKRYRNGVFHYQPKIVEPRLIDFLDEGEDAVIWTDLLYDEFCHFYWRILNPPRVPEPIIQEIQESALIIAGWIPNNVLTAGPVADRDIIHEAISLLEAEADFSSPESLEILQAVQDLTESASKAQRAWNERKDQWIEKMRKRSIS